MFNDANEINDNLHPKHQNQIAILLTNNSRINHDNYSSLLIQSNGNASLSSIGFDNNNENFFHYDYYDLNNSEPSSSVIKLKNLSTDFNTTPTTENSSPTSSLAHPDVLLAFSLLIFYAVFVLFILAIVIKIIITICTTRTSMKMSTSSDGFTDQDSSSFRTRTYSQANTAMEHAYYQHQHTPDSGNKSRQLKVQRPHRINIHLQDMTSVIINNNNNNNISCENPITRSPSMIEYPMFEGADSIVGCGIDVKVIDVDS